MTFIKCLWVMGASLALFAACGSGDDDDSGGSACDRGCTATVAAACPIGPSSQSECVSQCNALSTGSCSAEYAALQACADGKPITCDTTGIPVIEACSSEQDAFIACLS